MIRDILTIMWKERKGLLRQQRSRMRALWMLIIVVVMFGVLFPWQVGLSWLTSYWSIIAGVAIPFLLVGTTIPESIAGERERHTLSTLLASRLPDKAILFGKLVMSVVYGWGVFLISLIISLFVVNIVHWDGNVTFFTASIIAVNILLSLLVACFTAGLGMLVSLRAATVQSATMIMMAIIFVPLIVLQIVGLIVLQIEKSRIDRIVEIIVSANHTFIALITIAVLFVADVLLLLATIRRFRRNRLIAS